VQRIWEIARDFYQNLDTERRRYFWIAIAVATAVFVVAYLWGSHVPQQTLVTGRSVEELYLAAGALDEAEIDYSIDQERGSISVPSANWGSAGAVIAGANVLPSLKDVSNLPMGVNPTAQHWAMLRQKEGDLTRVLQSWKSIHNASIAIVPMTETFAFEEPRPASANVSITLVPGSSLGKQEVNTITHIVASAVDGLNPDNVTVSDNYGNLLAEGNNGGKAMDTNDPNNVFERKVAIENRLERNVRRSLQSLLGVGNHFTVSTHVELEMSSSESRSHTITGKSALISENIQESIMERTAPGGAPGVDSNLPERQVNSAARTSDQKSEESQMVNNYDQPKKDEVVYRPAGSVKRVSVAVNVNEAQVSSVTGSAVGEEAYQEYEKKIRAAIEGAIGYDIDRKDNVSLQILPFAQVDVQEVSQPLVTVSAVTPLIPHAIAALALVLAFMFIVRPLMGQLDPNNIKRESANVRLESDGTEQVAESDDKLASRLHELVTDYKPIDSGDLNRLVANQPDLAAQVIKKWNRTA
jgi:flagellar M-ring protein FliF